MNSIMEVIDIFIIYHLLLNNPWRRLETILGLPALLPPEQTWLKKKNFLQILQDFIQYLHCNLPNMPSSAGGPRSIMNQLAG